MRQSAPQPDYRPVEHVDRGGELLDATVTRAATAGGWRLTWRAGGWLLVKGGRTVQCGDLATAAVVIVGLGTPPSHSKNPLIAAHAKEMP